MSIGLLALLDDVVALAKVAATTLDDAAAQAVQASKQSAGILVDDAAVTPRYVVGFAAERELPIIARIAWGSLRNKVLFLLPIALALSLFAPWAITPLLMLGGIYLCFEGYEKVHDFLVGHGEVQRVAAVSLRRAPMSATAFEDARVARAIQTDLILSAEIMALTLANIAAGDFFTRAFVLSFVALIVTAGVYGAVALIVKADDAGIALAQNMRPASTLFGLRSAYDAATPPSPFDRALAPLTRAHGRALVHGMPPFLKLLTIVGTLAMLWIGGGIIVHGLGELGWPQLEHVMHVIEQSADRNLPLGGGIAAWLLAASLSAIAGIVVGAAAALIWSVVAPVWHSVRGAPTP